MDEIELETRQSDESLANVLKNMQFYSSILCSRKVSESISSDLLSVDSETVKLMVRSIDYSMFQKSRTVNVSFGKARSEKYVTLTKEQVDQVKGLNSNANMASQKSSFCLALGEVANSVARRVDSNIISPLMWSSVISPWIMHKYSPPKENDYFVIPIAINRTEIRGHFKVRVSFY